jgi:alpha-L-arabinofuranosidase
MVTNKSLEEDLETEIHLKNFKPDGLARIYSLWGNWITSTNEKRPNNKVRIYESEVTLRENVLKINFKKHSLTAIEITGNPE